MSYVIYKNKYATYKNKVAAIVLAAPVVPVSGEGWGEYDYGMFNGVLYHLPYPQTYDPSTFSSYKYSGGSGEYEVYIQGPSYTWNWVNPGTVAFGTPTWDSGDYYCKVRDKNNPSNEANILPYPITVPAG